MDIAYVHLSYLTFGDYMDYEYTMYITPTIRQKCPNAVIGRCYQQKVVLMLYKIAQATAV